MLSFLKSKLHIEPTEGIVDTESALEAFAADLQTTVQDLKFDIYDQIRTIRDPEKPQNLEELSVVLEDLIHVYPLSCGAVQHSHSILVEGPQNLIFLASLSFEALHV